MLKAPTACLLSVLVAFVAVVPAAAAKQPRPPTHHRAAPAHGSMPNPNAVVGALACVSPGNCVTAGNYDDALGDRQGLFVSERNGHWRRGVEAKLPAGASPSPFRTAGGGYITGVACPAAGSCVAVGRYTDATGVDRGVISAQRHGRWLRGVQVRLPANAIKVRRPKQRTAQTVNITAVACPATDSCVVVGSYETDAEVWEPLIIAQRRGRWARGIEAPLPAGAPTAGQNALPLSIVCISVSSCTISGDYVDAAGHQQALLISGSGRHWAAAEAPDAPADANVDPNVEPSEVACVDSATCTAVGTYVNPLTNSLGLLLTETHGAWAPGQSVTLPANAAPAGTVGDQTAVLASVACPQAGGCTAVGWYFDNYENGQGLLVEQQHGVWQTGVQATLPANAINGLEKQSAGLDWISCAEAGDCLATGIYTDHGQNSQGLLLSEVQGVWQTALEAPLPRGASRGQQTAATNQSDCTRPGDCTAIGEYYDAHGALLSYAISQADTHWRRPVRLQLPSPTAAELGLSLQALLVPHGSAAQLPHVLRAGGFTFSYPAVTAGTAAVTWSATVNDATAVIGRGDLRAHGAGANKLTLRLTTAGRALLAGARNVRLVATASFRPHGHRLRVQHARSSFTLG